MTRPAVAPVDLILLALILIHVVLAPYTGAEESFNLHATHDILYHGVWSRTGPAASALAHYDHLARPAAAAEAPRSFLGPLLLASLSALPLRAVSLAKAAVIWATTTTTTTTTTAAAARFASLEPKLPAQFIVRATLGALTWCSLVAVRRALPRAARTFFGLICCSQFYLVFYASRTLPDAFALVLCNAALAMRLGGRSAAAAAMMAFAAAVWRWECAWLLLCVAVHDVVRAGMRGGSDSAVRQAQPQEERGEEQQQQPQQHLQEQQPWQRRDETPPASRRASVIKLLCAMVTSAAAAAAAGALLSIAVDSYFWRRRRVYPAWEAFRLEVFDGKPRAWGVSPWHWYLTSALPRALMFVPTYVPLLVPLALVTYADARATALPYIAFVLVSSAAASAPKHLQTMLYTVPAFNAAAAIVLGRAFQFGWTPVPREKMQSAARAMQRGDMAPYARLVGECDRKLTAKRAVALTLTTLLVAAVASHGVLLGVSRYHYPGADALRALHRAHDVARREGDATASAEVRVYLDAAAGQSGASRFLERISAEEAQRGGGGGGEYRAYNGWYYVKHGRAPDDRIDRAQYTHMVTERPQVRGFERVYAARGFAGLQRRFPYVRFEDKIYVLRRRERRFGGRGGDGGGDEDDEMLLLPGCWPARLPWS